MTGAALAGALAFVVLAPIAVATAVAFLVFMIALGYVLITTPLLDYITGRKSGFLGAIIRWVTRPLTRRVKRFIAHHVALLTRSFVAGIGPAVTFVNQLTTAQQRMVGTIADMAEQTWRALWTLRHETVPRLITTALVPIRAQLARHTDRLDALETLNRGVAVVIGSGLRSLPWGVPGSLVGNFEQWWNSYRHLWTQTFEHIVPRLNRVVFETVPELARDVNILRDRLDAFVAQGLDALRDRLSRLEDEVIPRLQDQVAAALQAVDALGEIVTGQVGESLSGLFLRVQQLEAQLQAFIGTEAAALAERVTRLEREVREDIAVRLGQLEAAVAAIAAEVFGEVGAGLQLILGRIEAIETQIRTDLLPRLQRIEAMLEPAALAVLVLAALRLAAPQLFCRNVTDTASRICGQDEDLWGQLLAGTLVFAIALNPREIAAAGGALTGILGGVIRETVDN